MGEKFSKRELKRGHPKTVLPEKRGKEEAIYKRRSLRKRKTGKKKIYDSVFTKLFEEPEYSLLLYQALHPEDRKMTKEQIEIVTLENVLMNQMYNDLGFKAGDRLLILVESQSQWSENILAR